MLLLIMRLPGVLLEESLSGECLATFLARKRDSSVNHQVLLIRTLSGVPFLACVAKPFELTSVQDHVSG